jgi:hypothetical protein
MRFLRNILRTPLASSAHAGPYVVAPARQFHQSFRNRTVHSEMETINTTTRLAHLRDLMKQQSVDVYSGLSDSPSVQHVVTSSKSCRPKTAINPST